LKHCESAYKNKPIPQYDKSSFMGDNGEVGQASSMPQAVQGRGMQRDFLQRGGAGFPLLSHQRHGRLPRQVAHVHGHQGQVLPFPHVASEEEVYQTSCNKLGRGNLGREARPPKQPQQPAQDWETAERQRHWEQDPAAAAAAAAAATAAASEGSSSSSGISSSNNKNASTTREQLRS
jgi:hypothetical protein